MSQHLTDPSLINEDLAPIPQNKRTWGTWNYAALWISMSLCIPTYMLASSLIDGGMNWWQSILTIFLGKLCDSAFRQKIEHALGRAAEARTFFSDDHRTVDECWVCHHRIDEDGIR